MLDSLQHLSTALPCILFRTKSRLATSTYYSAASRTKEFSEKTSKGGNFLDHQGAIMEFADVRAAGKAALDLKTTKSYQNGNCELVG